MKVHVSMLYAAPLVHFFYACRFWPTVWFLRLQEACLVFLGTDEGDVRVFDAAGESPHLASYCVPWGTLSRADRPCPVAALSASPEALKINK